MGRISRHNNHPMDHSNRNNLREIFAERWWGSGFSAHSPHSILVATKRAGTLHTVSPIPGRNYRSGDRLWDWRFGSSCSRLSAEEACHDIMSKT
jgi:hypothetical protein